MPDVRKPWRLTATRNEVEGLGMQLVGRTAVSRDTAPGALRRLLRRFRSDRSGATAVEFAMVSVPFLGLLFAIFETAFVFLVGEGLDAATTAAAMMMRTPLPAAGPSASSTPSLPPHPTRWATAH